MDKICPFCEKVFHETKLKKHIGKEHLGIQSYQFECEICSKTLRNKEALKRHVQEFHRTRIIKVCKYCGKEVLSSKYESHINHCEKVSVKRFSNNAFQCDDCDRSYKTIHQLENHKTMVHIKFRYTCEKCPQTFASEQYKKTHMGNKHSGISMECEACGKSFNSKPALRYHVKAKHDKYVVNCEACGKKFTTKQSYAKHTYTHHKQRDELLST